MANEKWSTWSSMGTLSGAEKLVGLDAGNQNEYTTPADLKTYMGVPPKVAWVNFNGTGTVAIRASSSNVSSITDHGTGDYTVNFSPSFADADYAATVTIKGDGGAPDGVDVTSQTSSALRFNIRDINGSPVDCSIVNVIVMGN